MLAAKEIDRELDIGEPDDNYVDTIHALSSRPPKPPVNY